MFSGLLHQLIDICVGKVHGTPIRISLVDSIMQYIQCFFVIFANVFHRMYLNKQSLSMYVVFKSYFKLLNSLIAHSRRAFVQLEPEYNQH